jgi:hypothetical protein
MVDFEGKSEAFPAVGRRKNHFESDDGQVHLEGVFQLVG